MDIIDGLNDRQKEIAKTEGKKSQAYKIANAEVQKQKTVVDNLCNSRSWFSARLKYLHIKSPIL